MKWTIVSALTAFGVTFFVALVAWYPEYYMAWALLGLFGIVFAWMLLRNPALRYMRLALWLAAAWATAAAVPDIKARFQFSAERHLDFTFGSQLGLGFHAAFALGLVVCLVLDYLLSRENGEVDPKSWTVD